jgi:AraC-like DNA-binding protein
MSTGQKRTKADSPMVERAIWLIAAGKTVASVASQLNVSERTVRRWQQMEEFRTRLEQVRNEWRTCVQDQIVAGITEAIDMLRELMQPTHSDDIRLQAIRLMLGMLDIGFKQSANNPSAVPIDEITRVLAMYAAQPTGTAGGSDALATPAGAAGPSIPEPGR